MEEQRQRQEEEQRRAQADSAAEVGETVASGAAVSEPHSEEAMLERALALSTETPVKRLRVRLFSLFFSKFKILLMNF